MMAFTPSRALGVRIVTLLLGGVFVWSAVAKLQDLAAFHAALLAYELWLPDRVTRLIALVFPWWEGLLGVSLIFKLWPETVRPTVWGLCTFFVALLLLSAIRGLDIHCGCFGGRGASLPVALGRATLLCAASLWLLWQPICLPVTDRKEVNL